VVKVGHGSAGDYPCLQSGRNVSIHSDFTL
jgi:hypothetical protein